MNNSIALFQKYLPEPAVSYCYDLWQAHHFTFKITRPRRSKLGDYCHRPGQGHHITVNQNLNPYSFLITYLHEVAHLLTFNQYKNRKMPHGKEWKKNFRDLLLPVMNEAVFPDAVLVALRTYSKNPLASTSSFVPLKEALHVFDPIDPAHLTLDQIALGEKFALGKRIFVRGILRRTRVLCIETSTGRQYTVSIKALVKKC